MPILDNRINDGGRKMTRGTRPSGSVNTPRVSRTKGKRPSGKEALLDSKALGLLVLLDARLTELSGKGIVEAFQEEGVFHDLTMIMTKAKEAPPPGRLTFKERRILAFVALIRAHFNATWVPKIDEAMRAAEKEASEGLDEIIEEVRRTHPRGERPRRKAQEL
ncbi:MAG: hypothetical protein PHI73_00695 [Patescibacteria group bacterium]|nr:hypothetical protein [Patescibacteria group bacterium]